MSALSSCGSNQDGALVRPSAAVLRAWAALGAGSGLTAFGIIGYELAVFGALGRHEPITIGRLWFDLHVGSLNLVQAIVQRYIHPGLWDPLIVFVLRWPLWSLLGGFGIALVALYPSRSGR
jgi:hypothetical protein